MADPIAILEAWATRGAGRRFSVSYDSDEPRFPWKVRLEHPPSAWWLEWSAHTLDVTVRSALIETERREHP